MTDKEIIEELKKEPMQELRRLQGMPYYEPDMFQALKFNNKEK